MKRIAYILCLLALSREVLPTPVNSEDYQNNDATGFWNELLEDNGKAKDFDHWERIIHAASNWYDPSYHDNTQQIIDVQEYYRQVLGSNWGEDSEARVEEYLIQPQGNQAKVHKQSHVMKILQKPIPGRYIVMLESSANEHVLDKTITLCQNLHTKSEGRIRAEHITPIRSLTGFTATMNNKAVELVSPKNYFS